MNKITAFLKSNTELLKWTIEYFVVMWLILHFVFQFDVFSARHWWKFFHASFHGFAGFVFATLMYTAIPIYIATALNVYKNKKPLIQIPFFAKISEFIKSKFAKQPEPVIEEVKIEENESEEDIFPQDLPSELRVPFLRAKQHMSLTGAVSVYNKFDNKSAQQTQEHTQEQTPEEDFPIPTDFDISDFDLNTQVPDIPQFQDINFDDVSNIIDTDSNKIENNTTKYLDSKNIKYDSSDDFIVTEKYIIYEHNDEDFWIMDEDNWFASGKQKESPIPLMLSLAENNLITPVLYLASQNIMDIDGIIEKFTSMGIKVIKNIEELD